MGLKKEVLFKKKLLNIEIRGFKWNKKVFKQTLFHLSQIQLLNLAWSQSYLCFLCYY